MKSRFPLRPLGVFLVAVFSLHTVSVHGQGILNRVLRRTVQKAENKVEDMMVEKASEAIAERIYRSMSDAFDKALVDAVKQDSAYQANYSDSVAIKYGHLANGWMDRMNEAADVPPSYSFSHKIYVEITSGKDVSNSVLYLSPTGQFAMEQMEKGSKRIFLIDGSKDVTILYLEDEKGKKTAQAIPNMLGLGMAIVSTSMQDSLNKEWTFEETGATKSVAGYSCKEYKSSDGEYENKFYMTEELDASWKKSFSSFIDRFAGTKYGEFEKYPEGFLLESHSERLDKPIDQSHWITKEVQIENFDIINSDYEFGGMKATAD
jgi:hypothetical protein